MKPLFIAAIAGAALLAGGFLVASEFGTSTALQNARVLQASPIQSVAAENATLKTVTLKVENMFCASCPIIVQRTLERVAGVSDVRVSYPSKTATVIYDPALGNEAGLTAATTGMGYPSTVIR